MSTFGDIEDWVEARLTSQVSALRKVVAIATPEEFRIVGRHAPAAGVLVVAGDDADEMTQGGDQLITIEVGIWVSARALRGGENLDDTNGLHDLLDSIHTAFKQQTPTSAYEPLRYSGHELEDIESGLAIMRVSYRTMVII